MLCRWSVKRSGKQAFMAFKSAILHACTKKKMTNDSAVGAIWIQLVVASRKNESPHEWELDSVMIFVLERLFLSVDEGNIVSGAPLGTRILCSSGNNSRLMIDHVEIRPRCDRHQFIGNCIVFSWGNLRRRSNIGKKWVYAVQHSAHYVDAAVDMKRNCAAFPVLYVRGGL